MNILNKIFSFFNINHKRTEKIAKNIIASSMIKVIDIAIGILIVPLLLFYLGQKEYGIWLTMTSVISWFSFMNFGLGNGLRNKFALSLADGNKKMARTYLSTTYAILIIIMSSLFIIFSFSNSYIPWHLILNVEDYFASELNILAFLIFGFLSLKFVIDLFLVLLVADQRPAIRDLVNLVGKFFVFIFILILIQNTDNSLTYLAIVYNGLPILVVLLFSVYFYMTKYKELSPSYKFIEFKYVKDLLLLGWKFFIIQFSVIILFMTDNLIISQLFGPEYVVNYQIVQKYYSITLMVFLIFVSPMWSAYTEAYHNKDFNWIKKIIKKQHSLWLAVCAMVLLMTFFSNHVYSLWIGNKIDISIILSISWGLFVLLKSYNIIYTNFLNGIGAVKIQMYLAILSILINIPLSIFFAKTLELGLSGVILATGLIMLIYIIIKRIQYNKIISGKAVGIWCE